MQSNSIDCGVYALAFLTDLCHGKDPATCCYAGSKELRQHLVTCFENGCMFINHLATNLAMNIYHNMATMYVITDSFVHHGTNSSAIIVT